MTITLDEKMFTQFGNAVNVIISLIIVVIALMILSYIVEWIIFKIYTKCANEEIQKAVTKIIYKLDEVADDMSNKEKRKEAINNVKDLFIWRSIPIPSFVIGVIIDSSVHIIRKLQKDTAAEKDPYLHDDAESETPPPPQPPVPGPRPPVNPNQSKD
jgi:hypothetical protein